MVWLAAAQITASIGSSLLGDRKNRKAGKQQTKALREEGIANQQAQYFAAKQLEAGAKQQQAIGQLNAAEELRRSELLQSKALAVAGASGAGVSDPDISSIVSRFAAEGELAARTQMYNGDEAARSMRVGAKIARWEGDQARKGLNIKSRAVRDEVRTQSLKTAADIASNAISWYGDYKARGTR